MHWDDKNLMQIKNVYLEDGTTKYLVIVTCTTFTLTYQAFTIHCFNYLTNSNSYQEATHWDIWRIFLGKVLSLGLKEPILFTYKTNRVKSIRMLPWAACLWVQIQTNKQKKKKGYSKTEKSTMIWFILSVR